MTEQIFRPEYGFSIMYKIVDYRNGQFHTLFHGVNRSKQIPSNEDLIANIKPVYNPGKKTTQYISGFHVVPTREDAEQYLKKFKSEQSKTYIVVPVQVGKVWEKPNSKVFLTDTMRILPF